MPASSHGLPTSGMRVDRLAARRAGDLHGVHERPVRRVALERVPALDRAALELLAPADDVERAALPAVVDRQREAVVALLGDHPVAHVQQPVELALVAEPRDPADPVDDLHDLVPEARVDLRLGQRLAGLVVDLAHADVPLVDEPEQQRRPAPPAVRIAVAVGLEVVEEPPPLEIVDDRLGDGGRLASAEPAEARVVAPVLIDRTHDGQPERGAQLEVLRAAAGRDVDDPGPLLLADVRPGDDAMLVAGLGERVPHDRQVVERPRVAPPDQVRAGRLLDDLERALEDLLERPAAEPELVLALADLDVAQGGPDGRRDVGGQRPGGGRPDQQRLTRPVQEREPHREPRVLAILVALVHLHLRQAGPAARTPRHRVVAAVDPAAPVALGQEAPDEVVVLVAEREVAAADVGHAETADDHLDRVGDRAVGALDGGRPGGILGQQVAQAQQLGRVVPVHPVPEPLALLGLAGREGQHALLAQADELGDPVRLDVALRGEAEVALDVDLDPQALAVEAVLVPLVLAQHRVEPLVQVLVGAAPGVVDAHRVVGGDRPVEEAPAGSAGVLRPQPCERPSLRPLPEQGVLLGDEVGSAGDGVEHRASRVADRGPDRACERVTSLSAHGVRPASTGRARPLPARNRDGTYHSARCRHPNARRGRRRPARDPRSRRPSSP